MPAAGLTLAFMISLLAHASPSTAGTVPMCHGQAATLVGTPGERLDGTGGNDVIVTAGASYVGAARGDDLICVTGAGDPGITDGPGDDIVDTRDFAGRRVGVSLRNGLDQVIGGPARDLVTVEGSRGDDDVVDTAAGNDLVYLSDARGHLTATLGGGNDRFDVNTRASFDVDAGPGRDLIEYLGCACLSGVVRLGAHGTWEDDRRQGDIPGFENTWLFGHGLVIYGSRVRNHLTGFGCGARVYGRGGDDRLTQVDSGGPCAPVRLHGGAGDDVLRGGSYRDLLYGGRGSDTAVGGLGHDLCRAEHQESCED